MSEIRSRYSTVSAHAKRVLNTEGESGRFEFKRAPSAVKAEVLVAAANWVALDPSRQEVVLLVGVDEEEHPDTGVVTGHVVGLAGDLAKHVRAIQQQVQHTHPIPVNVHVIEEGVETAKPFLRLVIKPTQPPHYDGAGRRITRQGASTRPLTDGELLNLYLDREAEQFHRRFRETTAGLQSMVDSLPDTIYETVNQVSARLTEDLAEVAGIADLAAEAASASAEAAEFVLGELDEVARVTDMDYSMEGTFYNVMNARMLAWREFVDDTKALRSTRAARFAARLKARLEEPVDRSNFAVNGREAEFWQRVGVFHDTGRRPMVAWQRMLDALNEHMTAYPLDRLDMPEWKGSWVEFDRRMVKIILDRRLR